MDFLILNDKDLFYLKMPPFFFYQICVLYRLTHEQFDLVPINVVCSPLVDETKFFIFKFPMVLLPLTSFSV